MASQYLQSTDIGAYGLSAATAQQILDASAQIDAYIQRPDGVVYVEDSTGQPGYMAANSASTTLTATAAFGPGTGLVVPVTGPLFGLQVGDCALIDRTTPGKCECAQVVAIGTGTVTLGNTAVGSQGQLQFAHAVGATIEFGYFITESRYLPKGRSEVVLGYTPTARVIGGTGRYGYGRRSEAANYDMDQFNLLASLNKFGGPPAWEIWPANAAAGIDATSGRLWVPAGVMLAYYSEIKVRYVAGWTYARLPGAIKQACANIINNASAFGAAPMSMQSLQAGDTSMKRFAAEPGRLNSLLIDDDTKGLLNPFRARMFA